MYNKLNISVFNKKQLLLILFVASLGLSSCKKNNYFVDVEQPKALEEFAQFAPADRRLFRFYPIDVNNTPFKIPVGFTNFSDQDREILFDFSSNKAIRDKDFKSASSLIIPAGKIIDSLSFAGFYNSYPIGRRDTVKIKITGSRTLDRRDSFEIVLERYCDVILSELKGEFANTIEFRSNGTRAFGPYSTFVENLTRINETSAEGVFVNLFDEGWNDIKFIMDWSDPSNFSITVPRQATGKKGANDVQFVRTASGRPNTFSSCRKTYTVSLDLLGGNNDNVLSSGYRFEISN